MSHTLIHTAASQFDCFGWTIHTHTHTNTHTHVHSLTHEHTTHTHTTTQHSTPLVRTHKHLNVRVIRHGFEVRHSQLVGCWSPALQDIVAHMEAYVTSQWQVAYSGPVPSGPNSMRYIHTEVEINTCTCNVHGKCMKLHKCISNTVDPCCHNSIWSIMQVT